MRMPISHLDGALSAEGPVLVHGPAPIPAALEILRQRFGPIPALDLRTAGITDPDREVPLRSKIVRHLESHRFIFILLGASPPPVLIELLAELLSGTFKDALGGPDLDTRGCRIFAHTPTRTVDPRLSALFPRRIAGTRLLAPLKAAGGSESARA
jgi:hypothetical protein